MGAINFHHLTGHYLAILRGLLQFKFANDNTGGTFLVTFVPPKALPKPPAVFSLVIEKRPTTGADVVFEFCHGSYTRASSAGADSGL